jgi:hypothetical protein
VASARVCPPCADCQAVERQPRRLQCLAQMSDGAGEQAARLVLRGSDVRAQLPLRVARDRDLDLPEPLRVEPDPDGARLVGTEVFGRLEQGANDLPGNRAGRRPGGRLRLGGSRVRRLKASPVGREVGRRFGPGLVTLTRGP